MGLNVTKLREAVAWVFQQDALAQGGEVTEWNQETWFQRRRTDLARLNALTDKYDPICETGMCVAGWTAVQAEWIPDKGSRDGEGWIYTETATKDGQTQQIRLIAEDELGLTASQAMVLFDGDNDAAKIAELAQEFEIIEVNAHYV